jgi:outer membrane protein assembly factor BamA
MPSLKIQRFFCAVVVCVSVPAAGQKFLPKSIQFRGAPEYSERELLAAAGLKKGEVLNYAEMNDHSKRLLDTGMFATLSFKFDGQDLIFQLTPSTELLPIRLENLPLIPGKELEEKLHEKFPLYHGKVPSDGGLMEDVRGALEDMLAAQGVKATVVATPSGDPKQHNRIDAISFSITAPPVLVGALHVEGVSTSMEEKVQQVARDAEKMPFDTANSEDNIERAFAAVYADQGYAAVKVRAVRSDNAIVTSDLIKVPFAVTIQEGPIYKIGAVQLPPEAPVTQTEIDKILADRPGAPVEGIRVRSLWVLVASRYKSKGYLDCKITPHPTFDTHTGTVSYSVDVEPGPVYHLGFVKFDNVSDELRTLLIRNWQMMPGDVFDESYVSNFLVKAQQQDPVLKRTLAGVKAKFDATADQQTREVNVVIRLEK